MFRILTNSSQSNFNMQIVKVIGERKTFEPEKLEYLVVDKTGADYYVDASRVFETVNDAKDALKLKAAANHDKALNLIDEQASTLEEEMSQLT